MTEFFLYLRDRQFLRIQSESVIFKCDDYSSESLSACHIVALGPVYLVTRPGQVLE